MLHFAHRAGSLLVLAVLLPLGIVAWRRGHRGGAVLMLLMVVQVALGALLIVRALPLALGLAHNMVAAALLAAVAGLAGQVRQPCGNDAGAGSGKGERLALGSQRQVAGKAPLAHVVHHGMQRAVDALCRRRPAFLASQTEHKTAHSAGGNTE